MFFFAPPKSIEQMNSKFRHSKKQLLETRNCSPSNAGELAPENNFPTQKHVDKYFFTPIQLKFC